MPKQYCPGTNIPFITNTDWHTMHSVPTHKNFCKTRGLVAFLLLPSGAEPRWFTSRCPGLGTAGQKPGSQSPHFFASRGWAESQGVSFLEEQQLIYCLVQLQPVPPGTEQAAQHVFQTNEQSDTRPIQVCLTARTEFTVHTLLFLCCSVIIWGHN